MTSLQDEGVEVKLPGKILKAPKPEESPAQMKLNHAERRRIKAIAAKMLLKSRAYVLVMWNGIDNEEPVCVIDAEMVKERTDIVSKCMGMIIKHTAACVRFWKEDLQLTAAEKEHAALVAKVKDDRSAELAKFVDRDDLNTDGGVQIDDHKN